MSARESDDVRFAQFSFTNLWRLLSFVGPYKWMFVLGCVMLSLKIFATEIYASILISEFFGFVDKPPGSQSVFLNQVATLALTYILVQLFGFLMEVPGNIVSEKVGQRAVYDLRTKLFRHLLSKPLSFFHKHPVGRLVTRVSFDLENVNEMYTKGVMQLLVDSLRLLALAVIYIYMDWRMGLIVLGCAPVMALITRVFLHYSRPVYLEERGATAEINAFMAERLSGLKVIRIFGVRMKQIERMRDLIAQHLKANLQMMNINSWYSPGMAYVGHVTKFIVICIGGYFVIVADHGMKIETFMFFVFTLDYFFQPIRDLAVKINILQIAMASSERIFDLLDNNDQLADSAEENEEDLRGEVEFRNVNFSYVPGELVLNNMSFRVKPGEKIALVGRTGSGKTTIVKLIQRLYDIDSGEILVDRKEIKTWKRQSLRRQVATVQQDVTLFSGSLRKNISLDNPDLSEEQLSLAISSAGAENVVKGLKQGLDTDIRERGNILSVGQRQLISFARVMAVQPKILILDEATSHIDSESEAVIQEAMENLTEDKTCFIIAHRLSTIQFCDRIFVIDNGLLLEEGNHEELLNKNGHYAQFYKAQLSTS